MVTIDDIGAIIAEFIKEQRKKLPLPEKKKKPKAVRMLEEMEVHFDGVFPDKLLKEKAPNQLPEEFEYQKNIYQPTTKPYMGKALGVVARIWHDKNYSVKYLSDDKEYFEEDYPNFGSIYEYFEQVVTRWKGKDPNAVIVVEPLEMPVTPAGEPDQAALLEPIATIYDSRHILSYGSDHLFVLTDLVNKYTVGKQVKKGLVFRFYDTKNIWEIRQTSDKPDWEEVKLFSEDHGAGVLWQKLKGVPHTHGDNILYESYFYPAIPSLNSALIDASMLQMSKYAHAFPQKWEIVDECLRCHGKGMLMKDIYDGDQVVSQNEVKCDRCKGTGNATGSPLMTYQIKRDSLSSDKGTVPTPPFGYVAPDPSILELLSKQKIQAIEDAFSLLNIDVSNSKVKGGETALGKQIDREELFSFLLQISNELFATLDFVMQKIGLMRWGEKYEPPLISRPQNFKIRDEEELTEELSHDVPGIARFRIIKDYLDKRFNNDVFEQARINLILRADKLAAQKDETVRMLMMSKLITPPDFNLHFFINSYIEQAIETDPKFMEKKIAEQIAVLRTLAAEDAPTLPGTTDDILNRVAGGT